MNWQTTVDNTRLATVSLTDAQLATLQLANMDEDVPSDLSIVIDGHMDVIAFYDATPRNRFAQYVETLPLDLTGKEAPRWRTHVYVTNHGGRPWGEKADSANSLITGMFTAIIHDLLPAINAEVEQEYRRRTGKCAPGR